MDLIAWPTVPAPAPPIADPTVHLPSGPKPADPANVGQTGLGNLAGIPGISVPVGSTRAACRWRSAPGDVGSRERWPRRRPRHLERATQRQFVDAVPPIAAATAT